MKQKLRKRLKRIETTLEDLATEIGLVDPPISAPSHGPTKGDERKGYIPLGTPKARGKTAQMARKKIKKDF